MGHAIALINVENAEDIADRIVSRSLSIRQAEKFIKDSRKQKKRRSTA